MATVSCHGQRFEKKITWIAPELEAKSKLDDGNSIVNAGEQ